MHPVKAACFVGTILFVASSLGAQERAWQQRLEVEIPAAVPIETVQPVNPLASAIDVTPRLVRKTLPEDFDLRVTTEVAAYVDADGRCRSVVPLDLPFPGAMGPLVEDIRDTRFHAARQGDTKVPSWVVLGVTLETEVEEGRSVDAVLEPVDPRVPPRVSPPPSPAVSGRLASLPSTPTDELTVSAIPRRLRVRIPSYQLEAGVRLLVHVTADGRCDRYVPLDLPAGLGDWMERVLHTWRFEPAMLGGNPVECWMLYRARYMIELNRLKSRAFRVFGSREFTPAPAASGESPPAP